MAVPPIKLDREDLYRMTPREKKSYLLALVTIANSDDNIAKEELDLIQSRAKKLKYRVKESDLKSYDIQKIAEEIRKPNVRASLFEDLLLMAKADRNWDLEELKIIRYFSRVWEQTLPDIPSMKLTWEKVGLPTEIQVEKTSIWKRKALEKPRNKKIIRSADPGIRWEWVITGTGIYLALFLVFILLNIFFRRGDWLRFINPTIGNALFSLFACFVTGFIVGRISPVRTIREPAIGVTIPLLSIAWLMILIAMELGGGISFFWVTIGIITAVVLQFLLALFGAYSGVAFKED